MNKKAIRLFKSFFYTIGSNLVTLLISTVVILVIPRFIGVNEYGYWQLYIFYTSYIGFLHFGWNDGIYLRYGGEAYKNLNKRKFNSQFFMLLFFQSIFLITFISLIHIFIENEDRKYILIMTALCMVLVNMRYMLLFILQATNKIKEYAKITIIDRALYAFLIIGFLSIGIINFKLMIFLDLVGKGISLMIAVYLCKDIVLRKVHFGYSDFEEMLINVNVGIKLMISNIASKLIIGNVRFAIERFWSVAIFGKVSLILSISGFVMLFINAIGIVIFPLLRRSAIEKLPILYKTMNNVLLVITFAILIGYYPIKELLGIWLPDYQDTLIYMGILFPIIIYESKMALLINTYFKTLRHEKTLLKINLITLGISLIATFITAIILKNLDLVVLTITIVIMFRAILSELLLSKIISISLKKDIVMDATLTFIFIITSWYVDSWKVTVIYILAYFLYLIIKSRELILTLNTIKEILLKKS